MQGYSPMSRKIFVLINAVSVSETNRGYTPKEPFYTHNVIKLTKCCSSAERLCQYSLPGSILHHPTPPHPCSLDLGGQRAPGELPMLEETPESLRHALPRAAALPKHCLLTPKTSCNADTARNHPSLDISSSKRISTNTFSEAQQATRAV